MCLSRVWTDGDKVVYENEKHNHVPDVAEVGVKQVLTDFKEKARMLTDTPQQIIASSTLCISAAVAGILPPASRMKKRTILKARQHAAGALPCLSSTRDLVIPEMYTITMAGEIFLVYDSGASDNQIIIFSTERNLNLMATCDHLYADGTFKTSPPLFTQVFTIHGVKYNNVLPTVYALLRISVY